MPRKETILRVFVASPSDLQDERELLDDVIKELNITWSSANAIRLELIGWETHTYPSIGIDAQAVINEQIADEYDIFIGLMWKRFGSSTRRAGSGTEEEFNRAYTRHQQNPNDVRVMFYFKSSPVDLDEINPEQLNLIQKFKKELQEKGAYYWSFRDRDEFAQLLRIHLARQVQDYGKSWGLEDDKRSLSVAEISRSSETTEVQIPIEDDEGFFDLIITMQENFEAVNEPLNRITLSLQDLTAKVSASNKDLNIAQGSKQQMDAKQAKRLFNNAANALDDFATLMEVEVPIFANYFSKGMESFSRAATLVKDFTQEDSEGIERAKSQIQQFKPSVMETKNQMESLRNTISSLPRATTIFNKARKRAITILDKFNNELNTSLNLTTEVEKALDLM